MRLAFAISCAYVNVKVHIDVRTIFTLSPLISLRHRQNIISYIALTNKHGVSIITFGY